MVTVTAVRSILIALTSKSINVAFSWSLALVITRGGVGTAAARLAEASAAHAAGNGNMVGSGQVGAFKPKLVKGFEQTSTFANEATAKKRWRFPADNWQIERGFQDVRP